MNHVLKDGQSTDAIAATLQSGDTVDLSGTVNFTKAIQARDSVDIRGATAVLKSSSPATAIAVNQYTDNAKFSGIEFKCPGRAFEIAGNGIDIRAVRAVNGGDLAHLRGCNGANITDFYVEDPGDYGVYCGGAIPCRGIGLRRGKIILKKRGQHCTRWHNFADATVGSYDAKNMLADMPGFSVYLRHEGTYPGGTLNFREGNGFRIVRVKAEGPAVKYIGDDKKEHTSRHGIGFEPLAIPETLALPGWENYRCKSGLVDQCDLLVSAFVVFGAGAENITFKRGKIRADGMSCLSFKGPWYAWPAPKNIVFDAMEFFAVPGTHSTLVSASSLPCLGEARFVNGCRFEGDLLPLNPKGNLTKIL